MGRHAGRWYVALVTLAAAWAAFNCAYVYFRLGDAAAYRIESASLIFAAISAPLALLGPRLKGSGDGWRGASALPGTRAELATAAALIAVWLAIFIPLLWFPFLSDDYGFLGTYRTLADAARGFEFFRPLFAVVFAALGFAGAGSPLPFHALAGALHLASTCFVYRIAVRVSRGPAIVAAAVFLLNPAQLEATLWASGLQDVMWTFFVLAALACYVEDQELSLSRVVCVCLLAGLGLASKETAVCVVLLVPFVDALCFGFRRGRWMAAMYALVLLETAVYVVLRSREVTTGAGFFVAPSHYFAKQMLVTPYESLLHPWNHSAYAVPAWIACVTALAAIAGVWLAVVRGRLSPSSLLGPALIVAGVTPVYSLFFVGPDLAGARYLYFAAAGFGLLVAEVFGALSPLAETAAACTIGAALAASLALNVAPWRAAAGLVDVIGGALADGRDPRPDIAAWQTQHPPGLVLKDGIPDSYQGVWVFRNGYDEFAQRAAKR